MIATFFTRRNTVYLLVAMAVALSDVSAETQHHIRSRPAEGNLKKKLANKNASKVNRSLKSGKTSKRGKAAPKKKLQTTFSVGFNDDYDVMSGWVKIEMDGDEMDIEYMIDNGPESCSDCYLAIMDADDCDDAAGADTLYSASDDDDAEDPWTEDGDGKISTTSSGDGAGSLLGVSSGHDFDDNHCKVAVVIGPEPESESSSYSKSSKSGKRNRQLKSNKSSSDDLNVLLCGVLHKPGKTDDC